ncbi:fimbrial protein [Enterobacter ludwigii]|uniref:fimbrial protein n=1 Tax=Enterobacter ludwigii TaxID=299767 RepID=UPI001868B7E8|nr:type 1 fimbrial protein [Enterobacter ludwigii]
MTQKMRCIFRTTACLLLSADVCITGGLATPLPVNAMNIHVAQTVVPANCDLALQGGDMIGGTVDFGALQSSDLAGAGKVSTSKWFNLVLTNCGVNTSTVAPHIMIQGTSLGSTGDDVYLFKNTGTSDGLGFIFRFNATGKTVTWNGSTDAKNIQSGDDITTTVNNNGAQLPPTWLSQSIPVAVAVSTGGNISQSAGDLSGAITFTFEYR